MADPRIFPVEAENIDLVAVGASVIVLPANPNRIGADFTNVTTPSQAISLALGQNAIDMNGKVLTVYGSTFHMGTENLFLGDIYAICPDQGLLAISEEVKP